MSIEAGVVERLLAVSAVSSLVGNRVYADILPIGSDHPAIVYQLISTVPYSGKNNDTGKEKARIQLALITDTVAQRIDLSDAVKIALQRFKGLVSDIKILDSKLENVYDRSRDNDTGQTARITDFLITYEKV